MDKEKRGLILAVLIFMFIIILNISLASASFTKGNITMQLQATYSPNETLKGWINISLNNEPFNSQVKVFDSNISLKSLLDKNNLVARVNYNCTIYDCNMHYKTIDAGSTTKTLALTSGQTALIGLKINEAITGVTDFRINFSSDSADACFPQVKIDVLEDAEIDIVTTKQKTENYCGSENYGCFATAIATTPIESGKKYCQKMTIQPASALKVGADISDGTGNAGFNFRVLEYDVSCNANTSTAGKISCMINKTFLQQEQITICLQRTSGATYKIGYEDTSTCGYVDDDVAGNRHDFAIFSQSLKFDAPENIYFNSTILASSIKNYIETKYFNDCSAGCFIPIKVYSGVAQNIMINSISALYTAAGITKSATTIYSIEQEPSKITMGFRILSLNNSGLYAPTRTGKYNATIKLENSEIARQEIEVVSIPIIESIVPSSAPVGVTVPFIVSVSGANVTKYKWEFGDNTTIETTTEIAYHKYEAIKTYLLKITAYGSYGETSKTFSIPVYSAKDYINQSFKEYRNSISNLRTMLNSYPPVAKACLEKKMELAAIEAKINEYEMQYNAALNDTAKQLEISAGLESLNIPLKTNFTKKASGDFLSYEIINPAVFKALAGGYEGDSAKLKDAIYEWNLQNLATKAEQYFYYINYPNLTILGCDYFKVEIIPKIDIDILYVAINKVGSVDVSVTAREFDNSLGFSLSGLAKNAAKSFEFAVDQSISFLDIPVTFAPSSSKFTLIAEIGVCNFNKICEKELGEDSNNCRSDCKPWGKTLLILFILLLGFLIAYIALQEWYKRRYESWLFKDKNDLFNLMHFISNAENQGLNREEIFKRLKEKGWTTEQIQYAYKKYKGERTGMLEIPVFKFWEKSKIAKELEARKKQSVSINIPPKPRFPLLRRQSVAPSKSVQLDALQRSFMQQQPQQAMQQSQKPEEKKGFFSSLSEKFKKKSS